MTKTAKTHFDDGAKVEKIIEVAKKCTDITDADRCEAATKIMECSRDVVKSLGIAFDDK